MRTGPGTRGPETKMSQFGGSTFCRPVYASSTHGRPWPLSAPGNSASTLNPAASHSAPTPAPSSSGGSPTGGERNTGPSGSSPTTPTSDRSLRSSRSTPNWTALSPRGQAILRLIAIPTSEGYSPGDRQRLEDLRTLGLHAALRARARARDAELGAEPQDDLAPS